MDLINIEEEKENATTMDRMANSLFNFDEILIIIWLLFAF